MAHNDQIKFCNEVKARFPEKFFRIRALDCGSLDINGCNKPLFAHCGYTGIDLGEGKNVNFISRTHEYPGHDEHFDTIISTEMLEHDRYWQLSLRAMYRMLKPGGLLIITCASEKRHEHGTKKHSSHTSPFTLDWYQNRTNADFEKTLDPKRAFTEYELKNNADGTDVQFWGIKREGVMLRDKPTDIFATELRFDKTEPVYILGTGPNGAAHYDKIPAHSWVIAVNKAIEIPGVHKSIWLCADGSLPEKEWFKKAAREYIASEYELMDRNNPTPVFDSGKLAQEFKDVRYTFRHGKSLLEDGHYCINGELRCHATIACQAVQLAYLLGSRNIILCGVDMYGEKYFDGTETDKKINIQTRESQTWKAADAFNNLIRAMKTTGCRIVSLSDTQLDVERIPARTPKNIIDDPLPVPERVFILAPGPNGKEHWGEIDGYCIAVNKAVEIPIDINAWVVADGDAPKTAWFKFGFEKFKGLRLFGEAVELKIAPKHGDYVIPMMSRFTNGEFTPDPERYRAYGSISAVAIDIAARGGAREIILCGVDMRGDTYFDGTIAECSIDYSRGENWSQLANLQSMINYYRREGIVFKTLSETRLEI